jgi:transcriptional regulator with XRE-family HTH domain
MKIKDLLKQQLKEKGFTYEEFGKRLGREKNARMYVSDMFRRESGMTLKVLLSALDVLGFELVVRDKYSHKEWVVEQ